MEKLHKQKQSEPEFKEQLEKSLTAHKEIGRVKVACVVCKSIVESFHFLREGVQSQHYT